MEEIDKVLREFKYGVRLMYSSCGELRERRIFRDDYPKVGRDTLCGENDPLAEPGRAPRPDNCGMGLPLSFVSSQNFALAYFVTQNRVTSDSEHLILAR